MRLFSILTLSLFFLGSAWSFNDISPVQSQSPLLNDGPWGIDLPEQISPLQIRVLIFPHTLKKDYRHGVPDNPHKLKIFSESPIKSGSQFLGKNLTFIFNKSKGFKIKGEGIEKEINSRFIKLTSESPISLYMKKNAKKKRY